MKIIINTDGGCRFNSKDEPAEAAAAFIARTEMGQYVGSQAELLVGTNNVAEYHGVLLAAKALPVLLTQPLPGTPTSVEFRCDAMLIVKQMNRQWDIKDSGLLRLAEWCRGTLMAVGVPFTFTWVPREQNKDADHLCNLALDGKVKTELLTAFPQPIKTNKATCGQLFRLHGLLATPRPMRANAQGYALCNGCEQPLTNCTCPVLVNVTPAVTRVSNVEPHFLPWEEEIGPASDATNAG